MTVKELIKKLSDRLETIERYSVFEHGDTARILDKETGEHIGSFENIHKAKAFIKNKLSQSATCGKIATGGKHAN